MAQEGGCMCGKVRYSVEGEPVVKAICHCLDCRKTSGSTYSTNAVYPEAAIKLLSGTPKQFNKPTDAGNTVVCHFCGDCGSTLYCDGPAYDGVKVVKLGTLDDVNALANHKPDAELFVPSRVNWVAKIEGAAQKERMS